MKIAVFGTGAFYQKYKYYLEECDIQCLIDNNKEKQKKIIDGFVVLAPDQVDYKKYDYVIILVKKYEEIRRQLMELNVSIERIVSYHDIRRLFLPSPLVKNKDEKMILQNWIEKNKSLKIMVVSNGLSRTGVPVALMNLVMLLKKMKYNVLLASMQSGSLCEDLLENNVDYIDSLIFFYKDSDFLDIVKQFDLFIFGTVVLRNELRMFAELGKPIVWWLHESSADFYAERDEALSRFENIYYYAGGKRVIKAVKHYWGLGSVSEMLYFLPEKTYTRKRIRHSKTIFALIGTFCERKAQDVLVSAMELVPKNYKDQYEVVFVGGISSLKNQYYANIKKSNLDFIHIEEMSQSELDDFYDEIDVLICPSRDDPMPIVVTQAMQHGIPCVVSDQVGQEEFIQSGKNGFVFQNEDVRQLSCIMKYMIENSDQLPEMGKRARSIYEEHFSEKQMQENIMKIIVDLL